MASVPKAEIKAEMKTEGKLEAKEQREPKKPIHPPQDKPSSPKGSPGAVKKEIGQKKEVSPNKDPEQKSPDKKDAKDASAVLKKETPLPKNNMEQSKSPESKHSAKKDVKETPVVVKTENSEQTKYVDPKTVKEKSDKKDSPVGDKSTTQPKVTNVKSSPEKSSPKKVNLEEKPTSSLIANNISAKLSVKYTEANVIASDKSEHTEKAAVDNSRKKEDTSSKEDTDSTNQDKKTLSDKTEDNVPTTMKQHSGKEEKSSSKLEDDKETILQHSKPNGEPCHERADEAFENSRKIDDMEDQMQSNDKNNNESTANDLQSTKTENDASKTVTHKNGKHENKNQLRSEIWNKMFRSSMLAFRKPCNYRIPHFKGDVISAGRLTTMEIFQKAKVVKVSLDKAHECVRLQVIEAGKEMIVGCPGLREAVFLHVKPPMEPSKSSNKLASSRIGIGHVGSALDFSSSVQADLVIVGSVAVDRTGLRVGKGEGFADLEYALLKKLGGISNNAPIVTVVHDSQVYDTLPENLFKEHDVPADFIVTPTEVIEVTQKRKHPDLIWKILSNRRVNSIPIIKQLLDREQNRDGANISLKEEDTDSEELEQIAKRKRYFMGRRSYSFGGQRGRGPIMNKNNSSRGNKRSGRIRRHTAPSERTYQDTTMMSPNRPVRTFRSRTASMPRYNFNQLNFKQNGYWSPWNFQNGGRRKNNHLQMDRPRYSVDFSLKVQGLTNDVRVRDLKAAIIQRGIRPRDISWLPHKGVAFLHFAKPKKDVEEQIQSAPVVTDTDSALATLKDLTVKPENGPETNVKIEVAQPFRKVHFVI